MIADPFLLYHIVTANAEIAAALEHLSSDAPDYDEKHTRLVGIAKQIESLIMLEVVR
jgi:hypothetical protein